MKLSDIIVYLPAVAIVATLTTAGAQQVTPDAHMSQAEQIVRLHAATDTLTREIHELTVKLANCSGNTAIAESKMQEAIDKLAAVPKSTEAAPSPSK